MDSLYHDASQCLQIIAIVEYQYHCSFNFVPGPLTSFLEQRNALADGGPLHLILKRKIIVLYSFFITGIYLKGVDAELTLT